MGARKVLNETSNTAAVLDGIQVWNAMRRLVFSGRDAFLFKKHPNRTGIVGASGVASGIITMDDRAERAPLYRGFFISPHQDQVDHEEGKSLISILQVMAMAHMEPTMIDPSKCDGLANRSGCYDIVSTLSSSTIIFKKIVGGN